MFADAHCATTAIRERGARQRDEPQEAMMAPDKSVRIRQQIDRLPGGQKFLGPKGDQGTPEHPMG
jgi:hypothetical protein